MPFLPSLTRRIIKRFKINSANLNSFISNVEATPLGENWPVVYLLHNDNYNNNAIGSHQKLLYIGESTSASRRMREHFSPSNKNFGDRIKLNEADIVFDETFNKSAILDIEQELIRMFGADSSNYTLQNRNDGQSTQHQYYERDSYYTSLKEIWNELRSPSFNLAKDTFEEVRNSNLFKYSPYTALTSEQVKVCDLILDKLIDSLGKKNKFNAIIEGCAGTGKTVVLIKVLSELVRLSKISTPQLGATITTPNASAPILDDDSSDSAISDFERKEKDNARAARIKAACPNGLKVAYVVPLSELLKPFRTVIKAVCGDPDIVKSATEVANDVGKYDVIFVDEAHRLGTINKFGANKDPYKNACKNALGLAYISGMPNPPTELDWIVAKTDNCVFVYDRNQKVRCHQSITYNDFNTLVSSKMYSQTYTLKMQMRCKAGNQYVDFLDALFNNLINSSTPLPPWKGYDFRVYDDVDQLVTDINAFNVSGKCGLSRVVAGYGWKWETKDKNRSIIKGLPKSNWDIHIGGHDYFWNVSNGNFIFNADRDEIGCVHTVQGFDLNYVGVIFGPEIKYNPISGFEINKGSIYDSGVKTRNNAELLELTKRAYKVMMERGIRGCYVYACDPGLQQYLKTHLPSVAQAQANVDIRILRPINQLTGISVDAGGRIIKDKIPIKKEDLDGFIDSEDGAEYVFTIEVEGDKTYYVEKVTLSADGEYYIFLVTETPPYE
jgi:DUF2075 family protein